MPGEIASGNTNLKKDYVVVVKVEALVCNLEIMKNAFGDKLPIIPATSRVEHGNILYEVKIAAKIVQQAGGPGVEGQEVKIVSNRAVDQLISSGKTNSAGEFSITLQSRKGGLLTLSTSDDGITLSPLALTLKEAWYESKFLITGYNICLESDFTGQLVSGIGLDKKHIDGFLFSARGVPMQGTGKTTDGDFVHLKSMTCGWHLNAAQNRDRVSNTECVSFEQVTAARGAYNPISEDHSIAVDPRIIPKRSRVEIAGVGKRSADDTGSAIINYHIDNFLGFGKVVVTEWLHGGVNGTHQSVKYLGEAS